MQCFHAASRQNIGIPKQRNYGHTCWWSQVGLSVLNFILMQTCSFVLVRKVAHGSRQWNQIWSCSFKTKLEEKQNKANKQKRSNTCYAKYNIQFDFKWLTASCRLIPFRMHKWSSTLTVFFQLKLQKEMKHHSTTISSEF